MYKPINYRQNFNQHNVLDTYRPGEIRSLNRPVERHNKPFYNQHNTTESDIALTLNDAPQNGHSLRAPLVASLLAALALASCTVVQVYDLPKSYDAIRAEKITSEADYNNKKTALTQERDAAIKKANDDFNAKSTELEESQTKKKAELEKAQKDIEKVIEDLHKQINQPRPVTP